MIKWVFQLVFILFVLFGLFTGIPSGVEKGINESIVGLSDSLKGLENKILSSIKDGRDMVVSDIKDSRDIVVSDIKDSRDRVVSEIRHSNNSTVVVNQGTVKESAVMIVSIIVVGAVTAVLFGVGIGALKDVFMSSQASQVASQVDATQSAFDISCDSNSANILKNALKPICDNLEKLGEDLQRTDRDVQSKGVQIIREEIINQHRTTLASIKSYINDLQAGKDPGVPINSLKVNLEDISGNKK